MYRARLNKIYKTLLSNVKLLLQKNEGFLITDRLVSKYMRGFLFANSKLG